MKGRIAQRRFGPAEGLPLVALPGLNDGLAPLWEVAPPPPPPAFASDPVVVLSYPDPLDDGVSTASLAADLGGHLADTVGPCVVSGHSMGAMVALHLAADRPELVLGLVLGAVVARADEAVEAVLGRWERLLVAGRVGAFHRDALAVAYTGDELDARLRLLDAAPPDDPTPASVQRHLALSAAVRRHDASARLSDVRAPTLVLAGEHDPLTRPERSREVARELPNARFELIAGAAHGFPEQAHTRYTPALDAFIHRELAVTDPA